jgi:hypothetical protein
MYFWTGLDLSKIGKLLRTQTNSQSLRLEAGGKPSTWLPPGDS